MSTATETTATVATPEIDYNRPLISFFELSEEWQAEAVSNLDELAEECTYIEPLDTDNPKDHVLWDLSACMLSDGDSRFDGIIGISNNSALGINISPCGEACRMTFI